MAQCGAVTWELGQRAENVIENRVGTHWEHRGNTKIKRNLNPSFLNGKETGSSWYVESSHWLPEISTPKNVHQHFWPGLIAKIPFRGPRTLCQSS
jgi:hypothetical protein